jgi:hypothetical protein
MPDDYTQLRAKLQWEVTCERLRNALNPSPDALQCQPPDLREAFVLACRALDGIKRAFDIDPDVTQALEGEHMTRHDTPIGILHAMTGDGVVEDGLETVRHLLLESPACSLADRPDHSVPRCEDLNIPLSRHRRTDKT